MSAIEKILHINNQLNTIRMCQDLLTRHIDVVTLDKESVDAVWDLKSRFNMLGQHLNKQIDIMVPAVSGEDQDDPKDS